jgi:hypothetical protein
MIKRYYLIFVITKWKRAAFSLKDWSLKKNNGIGLATFVDLRISKFGKSKLIIS